jgi:phosphodiesterase/alkaline phosphatase D-like protein
MAFLNGIASGDTTKSSTILWASSNVTGKIKFEYSTSPTFSNIIDTESGIVSDSLLPVKITVNGLIPKTTYFYRVTDAEGAIATGQFRTSAPEGKQTGLRFGASGDWRGELSPYPAIANAPARNLEFFLELGDTIYADYPSPNLNQPQAQSLEDFRTKHSEVYGVRLGKNFWADLRSSTSVLATIDDHEVINDFEGGTLAASDPRFNDTTPGRLINDTQLYEKGLQAFQDYNPLRDEFYRNTGDSRTSEERKLYRYNTYGSDAATFVLDARSFRDRGLPAISNPTDPAQVGSFLASSFTPNRTMLGQVQLDDLKRDLLRAEDKGITWKFVTIPEPIQNLGVVGASDRYEGYAAERTELLKFINENKISNVVFVTADIHGTLVNNLTYQQGPGQPQIPTSAFEISTGSIAFDAPFGPTVARLAAAAGLINPSQQAFYNSLPTNAAKDGFIKNLIDRQLTALGYDPLGLDKNLPNTNGKIDAKLLQGEYLSTHTYGWTEFDINPANQKLTVTTYGIPFYTEAELKTNPSAVINRTPSIISQFEVNPAQSRQDDDTLVKGVNFLGQATFPSRSVTVDGTQLGGLSGITYDPAKKVYYAISDDRQTNFGGYSEPGQSTRFYEMKVDLSSGQIDNSKVSFTKATKLLKPDASFYAPQSTDTEGISLTRKSTVLISSEGQVDASGQIRTKPFINEYSVATGRFVRSLPIPDKFLPDANLAASQTKGTYDNLSLESVTISPNGKTLFTASENALFQDGQRSGGSNPNPSRSRIVKYDLETGKPTKEFLYLTDPIATPLPTPTSFATAGLVDLLALNGRTLLALERSFTSNLPGTGNTIKLYEVDLDNATNIKEIDSLNALSAADFNKIKPAQRHLLLNFDDLGLSTGLDNVEGLTLGPKLPNGQQSLVLVSDDNFNPGNPARVPPEKLQFTQVLAFSLDLRKKSGDRDREEDDNSFESESESDDDDISTKNEEKKLVSKSEGESIIGGWGNDSLVGGAGDDTLAGVSLSNIEKAGIDEIDTLTGGLGSDLFAIAASNRVYYNSDKPTTLGLSDYAVITDFKLTEDAIQLAKELDYEVGNAPTGIPTGAGIFLADGDRSELIAVLQGINPADLNLSAPNFRYV